MQVGGHGPNAMELAIDWLTTHPAEVEAVTEPAAAPAAAGAEASGEPSAEEKQLAAVLRPRDRTLEPAAAAPGQVCKFWSIPCCMERRLPHLKGWQHSCLS